ncbi:hypothetical protein P3S68_010078 [Capsicum galapagoense]
MGCPLEYFFLLCDARVQIDLEELPEQSQSGQNEVEESDNSSLMRHEIISKFQHDSVKTISIDKFRVAMPMNNPNAVFGDLVLKCQLRKSFDELRSIMKKENIDGPFKKSCFAHFLKLSGARPLCFLMIIVYGLLKHRILYAEDDGGPKEGGNKMDKVLINYNGIPFCFRLKEFAIVTGLRCDRPEEPAIKKTLHKGSNKRKVKKDRLLGIVVPSYKVKDLIEDLKNKDIPKHYREKLCLVWFVHFIILARDVKKVIEQLKPKTTTLYGFSWAFMAWVVHPWIVPTVDELGMIFFLTLHLVDTKEDPTVKLIKKKLYKAASIRREVRQGQSNVEALHDQTQTTTDLGASFGGVAGGVVCDGGSHPAAVSTAFLDYEHVGAQRKINMFENTPCIGPSSHPYTGPSHLFPPLCSHCKCKVCKDREDKLLDKLEAIVEAAEELKSRRDVIPSNEVKEPCTPTVEVRRKRRKIRQILSVLKSAKIATLFAPIVVKVQGAPKKVYIFVALGKEKKKELEEFINMKVQKEYTMHSFAAKDFSNMTNMCV